MAKYICANAGGLTLPDGTEVPNGASVEVKGALADNAGVKIWIADGLLVDAKAVRSGEPTVDLSGITAERDAALSRVADLEKANADLEAKVQALQSDLEAATKPNA
jgi:outer membrane murein-binding lipoprotein Lpp